MKYLMLLSLILAFNGSAHAEVEAVDDVTMADEALHTPAMDIEGQYHVKEETKAAVEQPAAKVEKAAPVVTEKKLSPSEKMRLRRARLEEKNRVLVLKKMEQIRYQQELALARKLEESMNQTLKAIDTVK